MNKILAIDFSTANTGYAFHHPETGEYIVGALNGGKSKSYIERVDLMIKQICDIIEEYRLYNYSVAIEEPIITMKTKGTINLIRANGYFLSGIRTRYNIGFIDIPNSRWASYNFIKGKRPERKQQSMAILESFNIVDKKDINDDMADAFCILLYTDSLGDREE